MNMIGIKTVMTACSVALLATAASAQDTMARGEKLAIVIEAYVPCAEGADLTAGMRKEVREFGATRAEVIDALSLLKSDVGACPALRTVSGDLLELTSEDLIAFDRRLGLVTVSEIETVAEKPQPTGRDEDDVLQGFQTPPPQSKGGRETSDYGN